jgi:uncharacterized protein YndB with AHSA1/START domain
MLPVIGIVLGSLVALLLLAAMLEPRRFRVERTARIDAPPAEVFQHLADFGKWRAWSPWEALDPDMTRTLSGSAMGRGAVYEWAGDKKAGAGRMEIVEADEPRWIVIRLDFTRPFESHNTTEFDLSADGDGTELVWTMAGPQPFMLRLMSVFKSMDQMVGPDFERGLAGLKAVAERRGAAAPG